MGCLWLTWWALTFSCAGLNWDEVDDEDDDVEDDDEEEDKGLLLSDTDVFLFRTDVVDIFPFVNVVDEACTLVNVALRWKPPALTAAFFTVSSSRGISLTILGTVAAVPPIIPLLLLFSVLKMLSLVSLLLLKFFSCANISFKSSLAAVDDVASCVGFINAEKN